MSQFVTWSVRRHCGRNHRRSSKVDWFTVTAYRSSRGAMSRRGEFDSTVIKQVTSRKTKSTRIGFVRPNDVFYRHEGGAGTSRHASICDATSSLLPAHRTTTPCAYEFVDDQPRFGSSVTSTRLIRSYFESASNANNQPRVHQHAAGFSGCPIPIPTPRRTTPDRGQSGSTDGLGGPVGNAARRLPRHRREPPRSPRRRTHHSSVTYAEPFTAIL